MVYFVFKFELELSKMRPKNCIRNTVVDKSLHNSNTSNTNRSKVSLHASGMVEYILKFRYFFGLQ
jgi:hypothetical protein